MSKHDENLNLGKISTESRCTRSIHIDEMTTANILKVINEEDKTVAFAVEKAIPQIEKLVDEITKRISNGGRLIYIGAGTSGRIGLMDAVECPPTYSTSHDTVMGLMAGGKDAFQKAVEGAEDLESLGVEDLKNINLTSKDVVVGVAASGRTPYVIGAIKYASSINALTGCIVTASNSILAQMVDCPIEAITGAEVVTGSTRMKSGTAQKMICNMISTATMIKLGKVYENYMIDVAATNEKLVERVYKILMDATGMTKDDAKTYYEKYGSAKKALYAYFTKQTDPAIVDAALDKHQGHLRKALEEFQNEKVH